MNQRFLATAAVLALAFSAVLAGDSLAEPQRQASETSANEFPDWLKTFGFGTGLAAGPGIAIWYLWYDTAKVKPRMERIHREQMDGLVARYTSLAKETEERHAAHWNLANANSREDLHELMKGNREDNQRLTTAIEKLAEAVGKNECQFDASRRIAG